MRSIAMEYSPRPSVSLSEREVFVGNILGKTGAQSKKQHDLSVSMKERFHSDLRYIVNCIVGSNDAEVSNESLERSIACLAASLESQKEKKTTRGSRQREKLVSFGYVAAAVCLREMAKLRLDAPPRVVVRRDGPRIYTG